MKSIQEVTHLRNTLSTFIDRFSKDDVFQQVPGNLKKIESCRKRIKVLDSIIEDFTLFQWVLGESNIRETDVIDYVSPVNQSNFRQF